MSQRSCRVSSKEVGKSAELQQVFHTALCWIEFDNFQNKYIWVSDPAKHPCFSICARAWHWVPECSCWGWGTAMITPLATILLFPFQSLIFTMPEGDPNHPLSPAALCNPCVVDIYSIFTLITLLVFHMVVSQEWKNILILCWCGFLLCSICLLAHL